MLVVTPASARAQDSRRRSPSGYHLPRGVLRRDAPFPRHVWAAALAAYAFRLQPRVAEAFERTRRGLAWAPDTACAHVRHGASGDGGGGREWRAAGTVSLSAARAGRERDM